MNVVKMQTVGKDISSTIQSFCVCFWLPRLRQSTFYHPFLQKILEHGWLMFENTPVEGEKNLSEVQLLWKSTVRSRQG